MKSMHMLAYTLMWVGGINWGLVGFFNYNLVESLGLPSGVVSFVYGLVGLATLYVMMTHKAYCKYCGEHK